MDTLYKSYYGRWLYLWSRWKK